MTFNLCAIGNACIDIVAHVDDDFLRRWNFQKSICTYLELAPANKLETGLSSPQYIPGGGGANTAAWICALGGKSAFMGRVAADDIGARFLADMDERGIHFTGTPDTSEGAGSTRIFALLTPDSERTFAAYYGVQEQLSEKDLDEDSIRNSRFLFLDGYALNSSRGAETFLKAAQIAKDAGRTLVLSPSDLSILRKYGHVIEQLTPFTGVIVCNEQEAMFMANTDDLQAALEYLQSRYPCGAVTVNDKGSYAFDETGIHLIPACVPQGPVTDTNGAGDAFAGGFLYGLSIGHELQKAARLGNSCAAVIITHAGARPAFDDARRVVEAA